MVWECVGRPKSREFLVTAPVKEKANPGGHVMIDEEAARAVEERYAALEMELQALRLRNEELMCNLQEQEAIMAIERLWSDRRLRA